MSRFLRFSLFILVFSFLSCTKKKSTLSDTSQIIGDDNSVLVAEDLKNIPEKFRPLVDAVGFLNNGCTVTHIGNGLVITAGHCINGAPERLSQNWPCSGYKITWSFRTGIKNNPTANCQNLLYIEDNSDRDFAIMQVDTPPRTSVRVNVKKPPSIGTQATLFGHPGLRPLTWAGLCTIESPEKANRGADQFTHQCDTEVGDSGAAVIDATTLEVIGIHKGGVQPWNFGTLLTSTPLADKYSKPSRE